MSEERLRQLLSALPEEEEIAAGAARARRRAMARLDEAQGKVRPAWRRWLWAACLVPSPALLVLAILAWNPWRVEPLGFKLPGPQIPVTDLRAPAPTPGRRPPVERRQRLEVHWVLSDGTRVQWTFDKDFRL